MEATNISINQASNLAIIIATLKAITQSALQATKQRVLKELTLPRLYRRQMRLTMAVSRIVKAHHTLTNIILFAMCMMLIYEAINYEFTTRL